MTAVEFLEDKLSQVLDFDLLKLFEEAKEMERNQHGNTWDAAIKAHDDRGVFVRSICDFDDYEIS